MRGSVEDCWTTARGTAEEHMPRKAPRFFSTLYPLAVMVAACGLLPVAFKPLRISLDPRRSTLVYTLAVQAGVMWSAQSALVARAAVFTSPGATLLQRFTSLTSLGWMGSIAILPLAWAEARNPQRVLDLAVPLEEFTEAVILPAGLEACSSRQSRVLVRVALVYSLLVAPCYVAGWLHVVAPDGADWTHFPAHMYQTLISFSCVGCLGGAFLTIADFAGTVSRQFAAEVLAGTISAERVRTYRLAWVRLRRLSEQIVVMPATLLALMLYLMLQTTLVTYQGLVSALAGYYTFAGICFVIAVQIFAGIVIVCDSGHRAMLAMRGDFLSPLQRLFYTHVPDADAVKEMRTFIGVVSARAPDITCGGFCLVTRDTVTAMVAAMVSYLIILIQFRQAEQIQAHSAQQARVTARVLDNCICAHSASPGLY